LQYFECLCSMMQSNIQKIVCTCKYILPDFGLPSLVDDPVMLGSIFLKSSTARLSSPKAVLDRKKIPSRTIATKHG